MPDETPSTSTPATPAAAQVAAPLAAVTTPDPKSAVTIPLEQLTAFTAMQARLAHLEAETTTRNEAARAEKIKLQVANGEIEAALRTQREDAEKALTTERVTRQGIEERAKRYAIDGDMARELAGQKLVPGAAEQLCHLWRSQLVAEPHGDSYRVQTPTFQSVKDFVSTQLAQPNYAHFLMPGTSGGTGGTAGGGLSSPTPSANATPAVEPKTLGEAVILHMQGLKQSKSADPRLDLSSPMGLRRTS